MSTSGVSLCRRTLTTRAFPVGNPLDASPTHRQELVPGYDQRAMSSAVVNLIGAGGIGGEIAEGLVRKGVGELRIWDPDVVEASNLNRQLFTAVDLYKPKATALIDNLVPSAISETRLSGIPLSFQDGLRFAEGASIGICAPDNDDVRVFASRFHAERRLPLIVTAVGEDANNAYVFVYEPGGPCFGCLFPDRVSGGERVACVPVAAVKDILNVVAGVALFAVDTVLMDRKRGWNYREIFLDGLTPDRSWTIERRQDCPVCSAEN